MTFCARFVRLFFGASILSLVVTTPAAAATLPPGFSESLIAGGLRAPTAMAFAPDGRLFVCEQGGTLRVIKNGALQPVPFTALPVNTSGERGLLGVAFDPAFQVNGYVYVYYTATTPTVHNRVSRFTAVGDEAVEDSETILLELDTLGASIHNGGAIHFGGDGKLYVAVGENAVASNAQSLSTRFGKILRINADGTIPADNPFYETASGDNRAIWALGVRNPFTFAVEPIFGRLFINDVGQNSWEEINEGAAGANYGWPVTEGQTADPRFKSPLHAYGHAGACAIAGGAFHSLLRAQFPSQYWSAYFFADLCGGWIRARRPDGNVTEFASGISQPVDLKGADDGSLYYLARGTGSTTGVVYRIAYTLAAPRIDLAINGGDGPLLLAPGSPLQIALTFDAGPSGMFDPAELYIGVFTPSGLFWVDSVAQALVQNVASVFTGPLPSYGPLTLITIPDVSALPRGPYWWFTMVDNDADGTPDGDFSDMVLTVVL